MKTLKMRVKIAACACATALCATTAFAADARLTWTGGTSGDWNAADAWTNESGEKVSWTDGAVAVLTGENGTTVSIPENVTIAANGIDCEPSAKSAVIYVKGKGILCIGGVNHKF